MEKVFGQILKKLRGSRGLTLKELEKRTDISSAYLSQLERDIRDVPTYDLLVRIAHALGVSIVDLVKEIEIARQYKGDYNPFDAIPVAATYVAHKYMELSDKGKASLTDYFNFLLKNEKKDEANYRKEVMSEFIEKKGEHYNYIQGLPAPNPVFVSDQELSDSFQKMLEEVAARIGTQKKIIL